MNSFQRDPDESQLSFFSLTLPQVLQRRLNSKLFKNGMGLPLGGDRFPIPGGDQEKAVRWVLRLSYLSMASMR